MKRHLKTIQYLRVLCIAEVQKFSSSRRRIIGHNSTNILHDPCLSLLPYPLTHTYLALSPELPTTDRMPTEWVYAPLFVSLFMSYCLYPQCLVAYVRPSTCKRTIHVFDRVLSGASQRNRGENSVWNPFEWQDRRPFCAPWPWGNIPPPIKGALSLFDEPCAVSRLFNFVSRSTLP